jgi:NAD(P)-dependent dehydrogenase (short-subunit alcohol dehydrogenase family)
MYIYIYIDICICMPVYILYIHMYRFTVLELDLGSFDSVKKFAKVVKTVAKKPLDRLVCNAAVYQPALQTVRYYL